MNNLTLNSLTNKKELTISSREIAELCNKRHDNVLRACRELKAKSISPKIEVSEYIDSTGRKLPLYLLNKRDSLVLVDTTTILLPSQNATSTIMLTNILNNNIIATVMGVETQMQCSCPTALVANSKDFQVLHYGGRALNKVAIPNKASLSLYGFSNLPSPLFQVTCRKENTMKESINPEALSALTLTDILNDLLLSIEELSCVLASSQNSIDASNVAGLLRNITNSTYYQLIKEGGISHE